MEEVRFTFGGSRRLREMADRAREIVERKHAGADWGTIFEKALEVFLRSRDPARRTPKNRAKRMPRSRSSRRIPRHVKVAVWRRDKGRCAYVDANGRCEERRWIEFDHIIPWALGGRSDDPGNVRLLCRAHNQHCAREAFGDEFIESKKRQRRTRDIRRAG